MVTNEMTHEKWMKILKWDEWPRFDHIHDLPNVKFNKHYYVSPQLQELTDNLYFCLLSGNSVSDKLFIGMPGAGKTTFLYWLTRIPQQVGGRKLFSMYHFEIFHLNRVITHNAEESKTSIMERCLELYKRYLIACNLENVFITINGNTDLTTTDKINRILDHIVRNNDKLPKRLIIIIDDIDETERTVIDTVLRLLYAFMEPVSIQKWLSVRETTLGNYKQSFRNFIKTKFPEKIPFPRVDLNGIVARRINAVNTDGKNPFSHLLCSQIIATYNYDIREAMGVISKFFELNHPKGTKEYAAEEWVERFFMYSFSKVLTKQKVFPNVYLRPRSSRYPLERDVFLLYSIKHSFDKQFVSLLEKYYSNTLSALRKKNEFYGESSITLSQNDLRGVTEYLISHELIELSAEDCYYPTAKGRVFMRLLKENVYTEICKNEINEEEQAHTDLYWDFVSVNPEFGNLLW